MRDSAPDQIAPTIADRTETLARLAVRAGMNVAPGQEVVILASDLEQAPLARAIAEQAYKAEAKLASVVYWDKHVKRARLLYAPDGSLEGIPDWWDRHIEECVERQGAYISIEGDSDLDLFNDVDPDRLTRDRMPWTNAYLPLLSGGAVNWSCVPGPTSGMAARAVGTPEVGRLWDELAPILRLDAEDPEGAWREHVALLDDRAAAITSRRFSELHFHGPGTDLRVGLIDGSKWVSVGFETEWGRKTIANLPTEEIFTSPDFRRVEGTATATRPLPIAGGPLVEGLQLRFEGGRVVEATAERNEEAIRGLIAVDDGAARIGELALVDGDSPVARSGRVFGDVLLDENATCHIAVGQAYASAVPELPGDPRERDRLGFNVSAIHQDIMIGGPEIAVDGIDDAGRATAILRDDKWVLG